MDWKVEGRKRNLLSSEKCLYPKGHPVMIAGILVVSTGSVIGTYRQGS